MAEGERKMPAVSTAVGGEDHLNGDGDGGDHSCPAFGSEEEYDEYVERIGPSRELICPITQEVFRDPVVAEDGHTYERSSILRWFSLGRTRSPVTNSIMSGHRLYPNLAVQGMALAYRERLGRDLLRRSHWILTHRGRCDDGGSRICALLDAGADTSLRDNADDDGGGGGGGGQTALLLLVRSGNLALARAMLQHDAPVNLLDDGGDEVVEAVTEGSKIASTSSAFSREEWAEFVEDVRAKAKRERASREEKERARSQANEEHRERQRSLAADARMGAGADRLGGGTGAAGVRGLGDLEDGWGYFPSLVALQFEGAIPPPSASVAESERSERARLGRILRAIGILVVTYLVLS